MSGRDEIKTRILFQASTLGSKEITKAMQDECIDLSANTKLRSNVLPSDS